MLYYSMESLSGVFIPVIKDATKQLIDVTDIGKQHDLTDMVKDFAEYLIKEMAKKQGVTEKLKAEDMMRWVGLMNNIRFCVDEIVLNDIVYS